MGEGVLFVKPTIYVLDDDPGVLKTVQRTLSEITDAVRLFSDPVAAMPEILANPPDLLLLDLNMPGLSGYDCCSQIRRDPRTEALPVIMVTGINTPEDRVKGFRVGADDYIDKPFYPPELVARIQAVLRRVHGGGEQRIVAGEVEIDPRSHDVFVRGERVELTLREFEILRLLASEPGRTFERNEIRDLISRRNPDLYEATNVVAMHIMNLRRKIERDPDDARLILTVRQVGYKFAVPAAGRGKGSSERRA